MSRRKPRPETFDVVEFLRESDDDLKSALNSLLRSPTEAPGEAPPPPNTIPPLNTAPDPTLRPGVNLIPDIPGAGPPESATASQSGTSSTSPQPPSFAESPVKLIPAPNVSPGVSMTPEINLGGLDSEGTPPTDPRPDTTLRAGARLAPGINLIPGRVFPIREMKVPEDGHSRVEQQVYDLLWQHSEPLDEGSRVITIGFGAMAKLVRLSESNARINVRSLIAKLAIEENAQYNCEHSVGRTYRIFSPAEILRRRREAGLTWYTRRTLAVVFVDPATGLPIDLGIKRPRTRRPDLNQLPAVKIRPGIKLAENSVETALAKYGFVEADDIRRLRSETARLCPDFTDEELLYFIQLKGETIARRPDLVPNPIAFLLTAVPKCFAGEDLQKLRDVERQRRHEVLEWYRQQQAIVEDPNATEEERKWAQKALSASRRPR